MALPNLIKNDTWQIRVDISDPTAGGNPVDITGDTVYFTMKSSPSDPDGSAVLQVSATGAGADAAAGFHVFVINWNDPAGQNSAITEGKYFYDFQHVATISGSGEITSTTSASTQVVSDITVTPA